MDRISTILVFFLSFQLMLAQKPTLEDDISDGYLEDYTKVEAAFILSGVTNPDSLPLYLNWYDQLITKINTFDFDINDPIGSAETVFIYLHNSWLKEYAKESTTLADIVKNKEYNCVAATILYNLVCEEMNWTCESFETPTHVYTIFKNFREKVIVENTNHMGFNIMKNLKNYSKYLSRFYPQNEVLKIGLDRLYYHENKNGREITNTELLGLLAYNRAYFARKEKDYKSAYDYVMLAQLFNSDSRSNVNFEIGLYYDWGLKLFNDKNYIESFSVFADGFYRYPDNDDFRKNTLISFFNAMQLNWTKKDWKESARLTEEIMTLEIMNQKDLSNLKRNLNNWYYYFSSQKDQKSIDVVKKLLDNL